MKNKNEKTENKTTIEEILTLDENDPNDLQICYDYLKSYLEEIKRDELKIDDIKDLNVLIEKFIQFAKPIETDIKDLIDVLKENSKKFEDNVYNIVHDEDPDSSIDIDLQYQNLYSTFLKIYTYINQYFRNQKENLLDFDGLINYDLSNKRRAISLIQEAIELIEDDSTLTDKSKERIIKYLTDAIQELNNPKTKWKNFFTVIKEVGIALSLLANIVNGINAGNNLLEAKEKVENANKEIVYTSLNLNYRNVENTFNIQKDIEIKDNQIRMIEGNEE